MLSNTATPIYYGEFREKVLAGIIPVNQEISMQMNRIDTLIADPRYYYDDEAINGFVAFCENELTLTDGSDVKLLDSFKLWAEDLLAWFEFVERDVYEPNDEFTGGHYVRKLIRKRLVNKQFIITARGSAKSMYASFMQMYFLVVNLDTTQQLATSATMRQAEEILGPMRTAIVRSKGPLFKFLTEGSINNTTGSKANRPKLASTKKGIENFLTNSIVEVRPMRVDVLQGFRHKVATIDEWLSGDIRENVIGAVEQGASKNDDYVIIATSSEGTVRNSVGDDIKMELMDILKGVYDNPHVSIWYYRLDDVKEVADPSMWIKANPNLGKTVSYETYQLDVERAEKVPSTRNDILAKRFGIPLEGYTYFFTYEETIPHPPRSYWNMPCAMGMDASQGDDFWSFTWLFPLKGMQFGVKTLCYISERTMLSLPASTREKYTEFLNEGSLRVLSGAVLDWMEVYDDMIGYIDQNHYDVTCFGFDPYNAKAFVERWTMENGPFGVDKVPQGARTESVPLGEIKHLAESGLLIFDQKMMQFTMGNAIVLKDTNGNQKLFKKRADNKIDSVAALMDAMVSYKLHKDAFE